MFLKLSDLIYVTLLFMGLPDKILKTEAENFFSKSLVPVMLKTNRSHIYIYIQHSGKIRWINNAWASSTKRRCYLVKVKLFHFSKRSFYLAVKKILNNSKSFGNELQ